MQDVATERKARSERFLKEKGVLINPHLPRIEDESEARFRTPEEMLKRGICALMITQIAMDCLDEGEGIKDSAEFFGGMIMRFGLEDELTEDEKPFFTLMENDEEQPDEQTASNMSWRVEMCFPLFWACGLCGELPYPGEVSEYVPELAKKIMSCQSFDELKKLLNPRSKAEILDEADLIFRMDWACVEARIKGMEPSGGLSPDVEVERHKGLNWIIGAYDSEDWDKVVPNT